MVIRYILRYCIIRPLQFFFLDSGPADQEITKIREKKKSYFCGNFFFFFFFVNLYLFIYIIYLCSGVGASQEEQFTKISWLYIFDKIIQIWIKCFYFTADVPRWVFLVKLLIPIAFSGMIPLQSRSLINVLACEPQKCVKTAVYMHASLHEILLCNASPHYQYLKINISEKNISSRACTYMYDVHKINRI
jgi:hypothetical protein